MAATDTCTFCAIARGDLEAEVVYRDDATCAFLDHRPLFPGHTLVIPIEHHVTLSDLPATLIEHYFGAVQRLVRVVEAVMEAEGSFVAINNIVSQSVPHLHAHVVPRRRKDGLRGFFWPRSKYGSPEQMSEVGERLRAALAAETS